MARNIRAARLEDVARPVVAVGNDYPAGHLHAPHRHRRAQLLFAETGTMLVQTAEGAWMVPPHQAIWIPGGITHSITMLGRVATRSVYLDHRAAAGMEGQCQVVGVAPLLRELLIAAVDLPIEYETQGRADRIMALLVDEIRTAPVLPLNLPLPDDKRLAALHREAHGAGHDRGLVPRRGREPPQLHAALPARDRHDLLGLAAPRLLRGERVTTIAFDLRYSSPAAFTTMFTRLVGQSPSAWRAPGYRPAPRRARSRRPAGSRRPASR